MKKLRSLAFIAMACMASTAITADAPASIITWETSVDLFVGGNNDGFVSTNGTLANAINYTTDTTLNPLLNGVQFVDANNNGTAVAGVTGETIVLGSGGDNTGAFGDGAFSGLGNVFDLLRTGAFNINNVTLGNLVVGNTYEIQIFSHDGRASRNDAATGFGDGTGSGPVGLLDLNNTEANISNITPGTAGTGDFIIGTFTATETTQTFQVFGDANLADNGGVPNFSSGNSQSAINAIQLRTTAVASAIPEPTSLALLAFGAMGVVARRRR